MEIRQIALILNINKPYDRKVVEGVSRYMREVGNWSLYLEDDPLSKIPDFKSWPGQGVIADLDDGRVSKAVSRLDIPVVGFGGGYGYLQDEIPYIFTNNEMIAEMAAEHLIERGFKRLAYCGYPQTAINGWCAERRQIMRKAASQNNCSFEDYQGKSADPKKWSQVQKGLMEWIDKLEKPVGIMAANDSRARHVLEACFRLGVKVPEEVAVVGVDDDEMMCELANPPLSSVVQGTDKLGYEAARLLDRMINGEKALSQTVVEPVGITVRQSTDILAIEDPLISRALAYIRENACVPVRVEDVSDWCDVSRSTLEKKFKSVMKRTVHEEISRMQLKKAKDVLINTDLSLERVSVIAGFSTVQYLSMKLKKDTGLTPSKFREKSRRAI